MTTVIEKTHVPGTTQLTNNSTEIEDLEASIVFYDKVVERYENSSQWAFKSDVDGVRSYVSNIDKSIAELSNK